MKKVNLNYYKTSGAEQYRFFRIPKLLFTHPSYKTLSNDSKLLYGLFLERMGLSIKNNWADKNGHVYIIYTVKEIQEELNCGKEKAILLRQKLEEFGLIESKRQGLGLPNIIYVKDFASILETNNSRVGKSDLKESDNPTSESSKNSLSKDRKADSNNPYKNHPYKGIPSDLVCSDEDQMMNMIKTNIQYDRLKHEVCDYHLIDELVGLIAEVLFSAKEGTMFIAKKMLPIHFVQTQFRQLRYEHIKYIYDTFQSNTTNVRNIKQYLLAALFNAPNTRKCNKRALTNYELYGGGYVEDEDET